MSLSAIFDNKCINSKISSNSWLCSDILAMLGCFWPFFDFFQGFGSLLFEMERTDQEDPIVLGDKRREEKH